MKDIVRPKNIYFTSDWHLFHENCLKFDDRPFRNITHMHTVLINNYNNTVSENDTCYFLGDLGMGNTNDLKEVIGQLKGTKVFIRGNHDKGGDRKYAYIGFDVVLYGAQFVIANEIVTATHCPLLGLYREDITGMRGQEGNNWHGEHRNQRFSTVDRGQYHLHGHVHSPNEGRSERILGKQMDVGVVGNKYRPISISQVESWIAKNEKKRATVSSPFTKD